MNTARVRGAYQQSESQTQIHPVKLIHLMFERVLTHLDLVEEGVLQNDAKLRGENLSKAIAIITELNVSIKDGDDSEAANFLRGLYSAILVELPKVAMNNDGEIVKKAYQYIHRLKEIWEETAMVEAGLAGSEENTKKKAASVQSESLAPDNPSQENKTYGKTASQTPSQAASQTASQASLPSQGLSVSI